MQRLLSVHFPRCSFYSRGGALWELPLTAGAIGWRVSFQFDRPHLGWTVQSQVQIHVVSILLKSHTLPHFFLWLDRNKCEWKIMCCQVRANGKILEIDRNSWQIFRKHNKSFENTTSRNNFNSRKRPPRLADPIRWPDFRSSRMPGLAFHYCRGRTKDPQRIAWRTPLCLSNFG